MRWEGKGAWSETAASSPAPILHVPKVWTRKGSVLLGTETPRGLAREPAWSWPKRGYKYGPWETVAKFTSSVWLTKPHGLKLVFPCEQRPYVLDRNGSTLSLWRGDLHLRPQGWSTHIFRKGVLPVKKEQSTQRTKSPSVRHVKKTNCRIRPAKLQTLSFSVTDLKTSLCTVFNFFF